MVSELHRVESLSVIYAKGVELAGDEILGLFSGGLLLGVALDLLERSLAGALDGVQIHVEGLLLYHDAGVLQPHVAEAAVGHMLLKYCRIGVVFQHVLQ